MCKFPIMCTNKLLVFSMHCHIKLKKSITFDAPAHKYRIYTPRNPHTSLWQQRHHYSSNTSTPQLLRHYPLRLSAPAKTDFRLSYQLRKLSDKQHTRSYLKSKHSTILCSTKMVIIIIINHTFIHMTFTLLVQLVVNATPASIV